MKIGEFGSHKRIRTAKGELCNKRTSGDLPNKSIGETDQNIKNSPEDLRRFSKKPPND